MKVIGIAFMIIGVIFGIIFETANRYAAYEELAELIQAAREDVENIKEELADVMVMLEQIKYLYGFSEIEIRRDGHAGTDQVPVRILRDRD